MIFIEILSSLLKKVLQSKNVNLNDQSHYPKIEENEVSKLLDDRIQFKLWSAKKHLDKLVKIENNYGGIMGKNRIYAEDELDCYFAQIIGARDALLMLINEKFHLNLVEKDVNIESIKKELIKIKKQNILKELDDLSKDRTSWYWILKELRNKSIHKSILNKKALVNISENINDNTNSSTVKNYLLLPPDYKDPMKKETLVFLSDTIKEMRKLIEDIKNVGKI
jgi:hypothetical protein